MREGYSLKFLRIPIRILFFRVLEVLPELDVVIEVFQCMLEPVFEDGSGPIVGPSLISIDDMDQDSHFGLVGVVFEDLDDLCFGDVLVLDGKTALDMLVHLFGHEVESLDLRNEVHQLFLQLDLFLLDQEVLDFLCIFCSFAGLHLILADDVGIVADNGLDIELFLHLLLLLLDFYLNQAVFLLCFHLYLGHFLL